MTKAELAELHLKLGDARKRESLSHRAEEAVSRGSTMTKAELAELYLKLGDARKRESLSHQLQQARHDVAAIRALLGLEDDDPDLLPNDALEAVKAIDKAIEDARC